MSERTVSCLGCEYYTLCPFTHRERPHLTSEEKRRLLKAIASAKDPEEIAKLEQTLLGKAKRYIESWEKCIRGQKDWSEEEKTKAIQQLEREKELWISELKVDIEEAKKGYK